MHTRSAMPTASAFRVVRALIVGVVVLALTGCTVRLVGDYDENIDRGLTAYQESISAFLSKMAVAEGDAARYRTNREFYQQAGAKLDTLVTRARASEDGNCLPANVIGDGIQRLVETVLKLEGLASQIPESGAIFARLKEPRSGSCTVIVLLVVKDNHDIVELIHKHNDRLAPVVVDIVRPTVEQGVRIALKNELAKKRGQN